MSKERAAKVMQEIFSKGTYEGDLLGINEGRKMKDTVTYPLSAIMGEEENRIEHLERELAEAKEQLRLCNVDQFTTAAELAEARAQLPAEMQECNIVFKQCKLGHGWLTATNWVQHECQICELAEAIAKERERCAKVCEGRAGPNSMGAYQILMSAADAIRRGE